MVEKIYALDAESLAGLQAALGGRSGGGDGGLEARLAKVEASVEHIKTDVADIKQDLRLMLGAIIGSFLILAGMVIANYLMLSAKLDAPPKVTVVTVPTPVPAKP